MLGAAGETLASIPQSHAVNISIISGFDVGGSRPALYIPLAA
jgi:hypothetical protein